MKVETYRGVRLKVKRGGFYTIQRYVNGVRFVDTMGHPGKDDQKALDSLKGYVDQAIAEPERYEPHWQPRFREPK
jgi:hypothetical protein